MKELSWQTASKSNPGAKPYTTKLMADGKLLCNCKGWTTRKNDQPRECTHTKKFVKDNALELEARGEFVYVVSGPLAPTTLIAGVGPAIVGVGVPTRPPRISEETVARLALAVPAPMLASPMERLLKGKAFDTAYSVGWVMEEKIDGHRITVLKSGAELAAWARPGHDKPALRRQLPPHIVAAFAYLADGIYDGELVGPGGKSWEVTSDVHLLYVAFDMLAIGDVSYLKTPYAERRAALLAQLQKLPKRQQAITTVESVQPSWKGIEEIWARGGEGVILKRIDSDVRPGHRVDFWVKVKRLIPAVVTVVGFKAGKLGPHSRTICHDAKGIVVPVKTLDNSWRARFKTESKAFIGRKLRIEHQGVTPSGKYRHPMWDHFIEGE